MATPFFQNTSGAFPSFGATPQPQPPQQTTTIQPQTTTQLPQLPRNTKFVDLPSHIKQALLSLEKSIVENTHKAASPILRPVENDPDYFLKSELQSLFQRISDYYREYYRLNLATDQIQKRTHIQHQHTELAIRTVERFKNPQHRSGLLALDQPMNQLQQSYTNAFQKDLESIQRDLDSLSEYLDWISAQKKNNAQLDSLSSFPLLLQQIHQRSLQLANDLVNLERDPKLKRLIKG